MKNIKLFEDYTSNVNFYWECTSDAIKIISKVLDMMEIEYKSYYNKNDELDELIEYSELAEWKFHINEFRYSINIIANEFGGDDMDTFDMYDGCNIHVYLFTLDKEDPDYNMDSEYIESGSDLLKLLIKLKGNSWMKKINEGMKHLYNYKIFEKKNTFININTFDLGEWYSKLNKKFFGGKLQEVPLRWNQSKEELGVVKWDEKSGEVHHLGISDRFKLTEEEVLSVLAHEMIHIWQIQNKKTDGHGSNFKKEMDRINNESEWGINVMETQPMGHLKMNNPDLDKDFGFIIIKNNDKDFDIAIYDPSKTDYGNLLSIIQQNVKRGKSVDVEVRLTQNGVIKQYKKESNNKNLSTFKLDELTFNTLMISSKKIFGGTIKMTKD